MHPFRTAIEARDIDAAVALLAEDVVFRSPVVFTPYSGREAVRPILQAVIQVFQDFSYLREIGAEDAADHALVFQARVGDKRLEGCDFLHAGEDGLIDEFTVMVRPLSGVIALAEAMNALLTDPTHA
ncbi:nuclear transport factor 2 family protein [Kribbella sancticallisti]|uniref:Nuclear transport factor 2 family protein n=1 Tax=Kribbella sancticallisti TaxID=460087 RepID=A0ABN2DS22_9ACTN